MGTILDRNDFLRRAQVMSVRMRRESGRSKEIHLLRGMSFVSSTFKRMSFVSEQVNRKLVHQLLKTSALSGGNI